MATENEVDEQIVASDPFTGHVEEIPAGDDGGEHVEQEHQEGGEPVEKATTITTDNLAEAIKKAFPQGEQKKEEPVAPKKLTPEEYDALYKVWKPSDDFVERLTSTDKNISSKALTEMRDNMVQQALTMAYHLQQEALKPYNERLDGVATTAQTMQAERQREQFMATYPELEPHQDILKMVSDQLLATGFQPKSAKEAFEKIAQTTEKLLQTVNPSFKLGGQKQQKQTTQQTTTRPRMAATSRGGQGGAGGGNGTEKDKRPAGMAIFD